MEYRKAITYQSFIELPIETRRQHFQFFKDKYQDYCPVVLKVVHGGKQMVLKMCKFLIRKNRSIIEEQEIIKRFILNHSHGAIPKTDQIVFIYRQKVVNQNTTVSKFLEDSFVDEEGDGWLHLLALTQDVYG